MTTFISSRITHFQVLSERVFKKRALQLSIIFTVKCFSFHCFSAVKTAHHRRWDFTPSMLQILQLSPLKGLFTCVRWIVSSLVFNTPGSGQWQRKQPSCKLYSFLFHTQSFQFQTLTLKPPLLYKPGMFVDWLIWGFLFRGHFIWVYNSCLCSWSYNYWIRHFFFVCFH